MAWNKPIPIPRTEFTPSPELSYSLGVIEGDGCVRLKGNHRLIILHATDRDFVEAFNQSMCTLLGKPKLYTIRLVDKHLQKNRKPYYVVDVVSKEFYEWYEKKSVEELYAVAKVYPKEYLRGLYDSEGTVGIYAYKSKKYYSSYVCTKLGFCNTNTALIMQVTQLLEQLGIKCRTGISTKAGASQAFPEKTYIAVYDCFTVHIDGTEAIRKFKENVGFSIKRKQDKLIQLLWVIDNYGMGNAGAEIVQKMNNARR